MKNPRGRKSSVAPAGTVVEDAALAGVPAAVAAVDEANALQANLETEVRSLAVRIGYQLPADAVDPDLIQRDIAANIRRSVEACLEVGRGLTVLKKACEHGNFIARLEVLNLDRHVAARFIQAATKFSNVPTSAHLTKAIGTQSKLFELLVLDDEEFTELATMGEISGLKLDDVESMSVKELRTALRETRKKIESKDTVIATIQARNVELHEQIAGATPALVEQKALEDLDKESMHAASQIVTALRGKIVHALDQVGEGEGGSNRQLIEQAVAAALGRVFAAARDLVDEYAVSPQLPGEVGTDALPTNSPWDAMQAERAAEKPATRKNGKLNA